MTIKSGVYQIQNLENGKRYIGSTKNFNSRKASHLYDLRRNVHNNKKLQSDYNLFGEKSFAFLVLEIAQVSASRLFEREQYWMDLLHPEYNEILIAIERIPRSARTKEARQKISNTVKELWKDPEYAESHCKPRNWKGGIPNRKGVKLSKETKEKLRQANLGENNPNWGKPRHEETKAKISSANGKTYEGAVSPDGTVYAPIHHMSNFCREHDLCVSSMIALMHDRIKHHKGWTKIVV